MVSATVYTRNDCAACTATKLAFSRAGVPFTEVNIEDHADVAEQLVASGVRGMPHVIGIDGTEWTGLNRDKIAEHVKTYGKIEA